MGGLPPTRPVASGNSGMNMHFSELVSNVMEPVANMVEGGMEIISTDDMISKINKRNEDKIKRRNEDSSEKEDEFGGKGGEEIVNKPVTEYRIEPQYKTSETISETGHGAGGRKDRMKEGRKLIKSEKRIQMLRKEGIVVDSKGGLRTVTGEEVVRSSTAATEDIQDKESPVVVVGGDVEGLYPNLVDTKVADICYEAVMESCIKFENVDYCEGVKYIAMNQTEEECRTSELRRILPVRRGKTGTRPGVTGEDPLGPNRGRTEQWKLPKVTLTELDKRRIVATIIKIGVMTMFNSHVYTFGGRCYLQSKGGPIGLRSTCAVARVTMLDWDKKYKKRLEDNNVEAEDNDRYMDDVRTWLHSIKPGWKWVGEELLFCESWRKEDLKEGNIGLRKSRHVLEGVMNNIHKFLKMTMETGDDFEDGKLPTLDINLWVGEDGLVLHTFYEKPMSTNQVLHKQTAMPENS